MSYGAAIGSTVGAVTSFMQLKAQSKQIEATLDFNKRKFSMTNRMAEFAQFNNTLKANEIAAQIAQEGSDAQRKASVEARKATSQEVIRRGEGITAGASVGRSVDDTIRKGQESQEGVRDAVSNAQRDVHLASNEANANEQMKKLNAMTEMEQANAQAVGSMMSGALAGLTIGSQALSGLQTGFSFDKSFNDYAQKNNEKGNG